MVGLGFECVNSVLYLYGWSMKYSVEKILTSIIESATCCVEAYLDFEYFGESRLRLLFSLIFPTICFHNFFVKGRIWCLGLFWMLFSFYQSLKYYDSLIV